MFENRSIQINFVIVEYDDFDDNVRSYDNYQIFEITNNTKQFSSIVTTFQFINTLVSTKFNNFICYEIIELTTNSLIFFTKSKTMNAKYDEKFDSNKRSHTKKIISKQFNQSIQFQTTKSSKSNDKTKRKIQTKQNKKTKMIFLKNIINEIIEMYDKSISIKNILKSNKIDFN